VRVDFVLIPSTAGKDYIRRGKQDEQFNLTPTVSYCEGSLMVCGGICLGERTELVVVNGALNADGYIRDVLQEHVVPFAPHIGENFLLMHDHARSHKARCVSDFLNVVRNKNNGVAGMFSRHQSD